MNKTRIAYLLVLLLMLAGVRARGQDVVAVHVPDMDLTVGQTVPISLMVDSSLALTTIGSYTLQFTYPSDYVQVLGVTVDGQSAASLGTPVVNNQPGLLTISAAGTQSPTGHGPFLSIVVKALRPGWVGLTPTGPAMNLWNEGLPRMELTSGTLRIREPQQLWVWSDIRVLALGETMLMQHSSSAPPVVWQVADTSVAGIDADGLLTAKACGKTVVMAIDTLGVTGVSEEIEVRAARLILPTDGAAWPGDTVSIPVQVSDLSTLDVISGQFGLTFNPDLLDWVGTETAGTLTHQAMVDSRCSGNLIRVVFSGSAQVGSGSSLMRLRFVVRSVPGSCDLNWTSALLNEDIVPACTHGRFSILTPEWRSIYPDEASLVVGETLRFETTGGGIRPFHWSVSDPTLASIDQDGELKALARGTVQVSMTDSAGVTISTKPIRIRDVRIVMPDTSICLFEGELRYPVRLAALPSSGGIYSFQTRIGFDVGSLGLVRVERSPSMPDDWSVQVNSGGSEVRVAASGNTPLNEAGVLFWLRLELKPGFASQRWVLLEMNEFLFNEGLPDLFWDAQSVLRGVDKHSAYAWTECENAWGSCEGTPLVFHTEVREATNPRFQWFVNEQAVEGATLPDFTTNLPTDRDSVRCRIVSDDPCLIDSLFWTPMWTVHRNPLPVAPDSIQGDTLVYVGEWEEYRAVVSAGQECRWTFPKGFHVEMTGSEVFVLITDSAQSGTVVVWTTNECGTSDSIRLPVVVKPSRDTLALPPLIVGPDGLCKGDSTLFVLLYADPQSVVLWTWPEGMTGYARGDSLWLKVGREAVSGKVNAWALTSPEPLLLDEHPVVVPTDLNPIGPIRGPTRIEQPVDSVTFSVDSLDGAVFYHWFLPSGLSGWSETNVLRVLVADSSFEAVLNVMAFNACGQMVMDSLRVEVVRTVGLHEVPTGNLLAWPNPFDRYVNVRWPNAQDGWSFRCFDLTGRPLDPVLVPTGRSVNLDFGRYPPGVYVLQWLDEGTVRTLRLLKR